MAAMILAGLLSAQTDDSEFQQETIPDSEIEIEAENETEEEFEPETYWYISNASGMALESIPSRLAALRNEYALSVSRISALDIPSSLIQFFGYGFSAELRELYENGLPYRRQWIFRDQTGITRLNASGFSDTEDSDDPGFIEIYNEEHLLAEERQFTAGTETRTVYFYSRGLLLKTETYRKENFSGQNEYADEDAEYSETDKLIITDLYRYTRSLSLRNIERTYHSEVTQRSLPFPAIVPGISAEPEFSNPGLAYSTLLQDSFIPADSEVIYTTDSRGRVLAEKWLDENGELLGELQNTWSGDRLDSVYWVSEDGEKFTEYEYDEKGNRITERNYSGGVLERVVRTDGTSETEELYMDGRLMLRAVYEEGRKISEERIRQGSSSFAGGR